MKRITSTSVYLFAGMVLLSTGVPVMAQDDDPRPISIGADLVSRYVWRGVDFGASPSVQPYLEAGFGGFAIGAWGAYATNLTGAQEMDLYANYTFLDDMITITLTDYFFPNENSPGGFYNYFDWSTDSAGAGGHILEAMAAFNGFENLPLSIALGYAFYGDASQSIYIELGYGFSIFDFFLGMGNGAYTIWDREPRPDAPPQEDKFGVVNVGISASKEISITDNFALPASVSLIANPNAEQVHLVFGVSF
jgi:hypothetical protein